MKLLRIICSTWIIILFFGIVSALDLLSVAKNMKERLIETPNAFHHEFGKPLTSEEDPYGEYDSIEQNKFEINPSVACDRQPDAESGTDYNYLDDDKRGPWNWKDKYPKCGGFMQSPINIESDELRKLTVSEPLKWEDFSKEPTNMTLHNNGHTVKLKPEWLGSKPTVCSGPLNKKYVIEEIHFHWGGNNDKGSEHTIDGERYPLEMHVVLYDTEYSCLLEAAKHREGILIIAYLFELCDESNEGLDSIKNGLKEIENAKSITFVSPFSLLEFDLIFHEDYVTYMGSLTTPPCNEHVNFLVPIHPLSLEKKQIKRFRKLLNINGTSIVKNYRPVQPTNKRSVYFVT